MFRNRIPQPILIVSWFFLDHHWYGGIQKYSMTFYLPCSSLTNYPLWNSSRRVNTNKLVFTFFVFVKWRHPWRKQSGISVFLKQIRGCTLPLIFSFIGSDIFICRLLYCQWHIPMIKCINDIIPGILGWLVASIKWLMHRLRPLVIRIVFASLNAKALGTRLKTYALMDEVKWIISVETFPVVLKQSLEAPGGNK